MRGFGEAVGDRIELFGGRSLEIANGLVEAGVVGASAGCMEPLFGLSGGPGIFKNAFIMVTVSKIASLSQNCYLFFFWNF